MLTNGTQATHQRNISKMVSVILSRSYQLMFARVFIFSALWFHLLLGREKWAGTWWALLLFGSWSNWIMTGPSRHYCTLDPSDITRTGVPPAGSYTRTFIKDAPSAPPWHNHAACRPPPACLNHSCSSSAALSALEDITSANWITFHWRHTRG